MVCGDMEGGGPLSSPLGKPRVKRFPKDGGNMGFIVTETRVRFPAPTLTSYITPNKHIFKVFQQIFVFQRLEVGRLISPNLS